MSEDSNDKLQVRLTRAALERLIGGDKELELLIGKQALAAVVGRHLDVVQDAIRNQMELMMGVVDASKFRLSREALANVDSVVAGQVNNQVKQYLLSRNGDIAVMVKAEIDRQMPEAVKYCVERAINAMADTMIKKAKEAAALPPTHA